jgi:glyoxylase-like metal-dependent hydrolase (beta-lactamase superfamily II)
VLVDAGLGPRRKGMSDGMELRGGQLLAGLTAVGKTRHEITDVVCTHMHSDHVGWLFDRHAQMVFPGARIWFGEADWEYFVDGPGEMDAHVRAGLRRHETSSRLRPLNHDTEVAPGVTTVATPGHTPGHVCVMVDFGDRRSLLLGDAITHPVQLEEPTWHSFGDVDADLANRTRQRLWRALEDPLLTGVGAHFPGLQFGRVCIGASRTWCS